MNQKNHKKYFSATSIAILVIGIFSLSATTPQSSVYASSMGTEDFNGFLRYDPLSDYSMATGSEYYIGSAIKNFRSDGSMRIDFKGYDTDSLMIGGYFHPENGGTDCATEGGEFYGAKMNGGPHNNTPPNPAGETVTTPWPNQNAADTMDLEVINMDGDESRFRPEKTHTSDGSGYGEWMLSQSGNSFPNESLCDASPDGWIGILAYKLNLDSNCDGLPDRVSVIGYVDVSGLNGDGTPKNNWQRTYKQTFTPPSIDLKSVYVPWVQTVDHSADTYQTLRVDHQSQSAWLNSQSNGDNVYRYATLKEIVDLHKDTCYPTTHMSDTTASSSMGAYSTRPIQAQYVTSTSELVGDSIDSMTVKLRKSGTPVGTAQIGVFNSDLSVKKLFGTISASSLGTSFADYTFTLTNNELYTIASGDRIGVKFTGGDSSNSVSVMRDNDPADPFDGTNSYRQHYTTSWSSYTTEDLYMVLIQTHG